MSIFEVWLIALGLSMDAFAVSITNGLVYEGGRKQMLLTAAAFGIFQAVMPVIGYLLGSMLYDIISSYDHWIALVLLVIIGGKMMIDGIRDIKKSRSGETDGRETERKKLTVRMLLLQAVATSIDALAVGISFAALTVNMWTAAPLIGVTTFGISLCGSLIGNKVGGILKNSAQIIGGVILIGIGVKIFLEHTLA